MYLETEGARIRAAGWRRKGCIMDLQVQINIPADELTRLTKIYKKG